VRPVRRLAECVLVAGLVAVAACSGGGSSDRGGNDRAAGDGGGSDQDVPSSTEPAGPTAAELCGSARAASTTPRVGAADLTETSGIAASRADDGLLWAHNDSGGRPEVFAVGIEDGADRGRWAVAGAEARDWEDMASGPAPTGPGNGPTDGAGNPAGMLYLGDIGDNDAERLGITVYVAAEPAVPPGATGGTITDVRALDLSYADGPRDAETLLADPVSGDLFVVSKQWDGRPTGVYRVPADAVRDPDAPVVMEREGDVAGLPVQLVTGGDVAPDGSLVALRTYLGVLLWDRRPGETVPQALSRSPCGAPAALEPQGEAIAFAAGGRGCVTISEGENPPIHRYGLP
jgi:hypothetical protein